VTSRALAAVEAALGRGAEADDVLRETVTALADDPRVSWAGIAFVEEGALQLGPEAGQPDEPRRLHVPVVFEGGLVGELQVHGDPDLGELAEIASLIAPYVLIGWDTGGEPWKP